MCACAWALPFAARGSPEILSEGIAQRLAGNVTRAIDILSALHEATGDAQLKARAAGELGAALLQGRRLDEAQPLLDEAAAALTGADRARYTLELGNLAAYRRDFDLARRHYRDAIATAGARTPIGVAAELNLARIAPQGERLALLAAVAGRVASLDGPRARAALRLNLGSQARAIDGIELAYAELDAARREAREAGDARLQVEALDELAQLYEGQARAPEAGALNAQALEIVKGLERGPLIDLVIDLEWRRGRLAAARGDIDLALASYQQAVESIEAARQDIPIEYADGRSSFRATLEPAYLEYANLLLRKASGMAAAERAPLLLRVRDAVERVRQAELQDYLRDRCEVEAIQRGPRGGLGRGVAVLYPIMFEDRIELLLETEAGIEWRTTPVGARVARLTARTLASDLRAGVPDYLAAAQSLHRWLIAPFDAALREQGIDTLVVVPEGSLRLVPFGALHDGRQFAIERFAVGTVTGLTMTNLDASAGAVPAALVAGMSLPGGVVDKLPRLRGESASELRQSLALPGVKEEVESIARIMHGRRMLDEEFTVERFQAQARSGDYRIVHIASHGVFGGSAESSYIMAFDDVLTMGRLQSLLRQERFRRNPIELLSLSACQTAEGDDRSPLGISGAAVKARAKSVLGTLWPVEDNAARAIMEKFYANIAGEHLGKVKALQRAQVEVLRTPEHAHPFFWAPFVLIGNWR